MSAIEKIRALIESQLASIDREVLELRDALDTLEMNGDAPVAARRRARADTTTAAARQTSAAKRAPLRKSTPRVVDLRVLEELLGKTTDGLSAAAIAKETSSPPDQIRALLKNLETAGKVRRTGQRRGTRWRVVTDEDWIAERAAELAARSQRVATERQAA